MRNQERPTLVLPVFIIQVFMNWFYIFWVKCQPDIILNSWFVVLPLLDYFYFTFAFISAYFLYLRKSLGLMLGCAVLMYGMVSVVVSYYAAYNKNDLIEVAIIPLIILNCCVILFMAHYQSFYKTD